MSPNRPSSLSRKTAPHSSARPPKQATNTGVRPATSTILLVDDDPGVLEALRRVLKTGGWQVIAAANGEEALEYLQVHQPDLMITDLSMAVVSGWDLLFHENLQRPDLPIIVITALPLSSLGGADRFAHEFFQKPLDLDALLAAVSRLLAAPQNAAVRN